LGIGDWGLGIGDWAQSPIPNPQSPIPRLLFSILYYNQIKNNKYFKNQIFNLSFDYLIWQEFVKKMIYFLM
jgi:hypothetical protein